MPQQKSHKRGDMHRFARLVARLMTKRCTPAEERELDNYLDSSTEYMLLFENLVNENKWKWARHWFRQQGVSTWQIRWRRVDGWYRDDDNPMLSFYLVAVLILVMMAGVYFLFEHT